MSVNDYYAPSFSVEVDVDIGHGRFYAKNCDLIFLGLQEFVASLDAFVLDRSLGPTLSGTYSSHVEISGIASEVFITFVIGDAYSGQAKPIRYETSAGFALDQEYLLGLLDYFKEAVGSS